MQFRMRALEQMRKLDDLDQLVRVAKARAWIAVLVLCSVVVAAVVWGFVGSLPGRVPVTGVLSYPLGVSSVQSTVGGQILSVAPVPGATVAAGQPIAVVRPFQGADVTLQAPFGGLVVGVSAVAGAVVTLGQPLVSVERIRPGDQLVALAFVSPDQAARMAPGMPVALDLSSAPSAAFGALQGRVATIGAFPLSPTEVEGLLGNPVLASQFTSGPPPLLATIQLTPDATTRSGFRWSTPKGPPFLLEPESLLKATITTGSQRPIRMVFGG
jgi:multidrug efflux pump subunit AcrA (membrane-fusion protein)